VKAQPRNGARRDLDAASADRDLIRGLFNLGEDVAGQHQRTAVGLHLSNRFGDAASISGSSPEVGLTGAVEVTMTRESVTWFSDSTTR